jgi:pimeloyl-ACP methyl ester carboxylesterase
MEFLHLDGGRVEYQVFGRTDDLAAATVVMLHEGLGSVAMWRDFPQRLADTLGLRVIAYSRFGYGQSAPACLPRSVTYMHDEALGVLPQLLCQLRVASPILFGHSDGASIALIHASQYPVRGVIALAPHVFVEEVSVRSIAAAKVAYENTRLRERLGRYHADVDAAFRGWNDIWLHPDFRSWNIEALLPQIRSSVLVIQGRDDEYGTQEQLRCIANGVREVALSLLPECGHSPHRDQPAQVLETVRLWINSKIRPHLGQDVPLVVKSSPGNGKGKV